MENESKKTHEYSFWVTAWKRFCKHKLGLLGFFIVIIFCLLGIYAPILASSKPLVVKYDKEWYFPLFRYLFYRGFFTKRLDIFFNLLIFTLPLFVLTYFILKKKLRMIALWTIAALQLGAFGYYAYVQPMDPAVNTQLTRERQAALKTHPQPDWNFDLEYMTPYAKLNAVLRYKQRKEQHQRLKKYLPEEVASQSLWQSQVNWENQEIAHLENNPSESAQSERQFILDRHQWLETQLDHIEFEVMPLLRPFHWEDDAGGGQSLNPYIPWTELTRINRKDLVAALLFGIRISLVVGLLAVSLAMIIGVPVGAYAGYFGGTFDILLSRLIEIWESMPAFFMLLMVIAITQTKSIFLVIGVIGIFGWPSFSRYIRGEFFKQRNLSYVEACRALGFRNSYIMFSHILPNAIPPLLTLLPFAVMAAITSEAGLSFLGLGEEGSCSWGVLMDEGRAAFPGESYLLWPPATMLTILLVAIALIGDALRDTLDPKAVI